MAVKIVCSFLLQLLVPSAFDLRPLSFLSTDLVHKEGGQQGPQEASEYRAEVLRTLPHLLLRLARRGILASAQQAALVIQTYGHS